MPTFFVNVNHFEKVQFCPNTLTAIRIHSNVIIRTRWALLVQCGSIAIIFCMLNDIFLKKMFKMFKLFDESVWMSSSGPVGPCQYILQVDIVVLKIEIEFFMILFWYSNFSKPFDQYVVISSWYYVIMIILTCWDLLCCPCPPSSPSFSPHSSWRVCKRSEIGKLIISSIFSPDQYFRNIFIYFFTGST